MIYVVQKNYAPILPGKSLLEQIVEENPEEPAPTFRRILLL